MKIQTGRLVVSEIAVTAVCAVFLYVKIVVLAVLVESVVRIVGLI